jgi:hypothetical protein
MPIAVTTSGQDNIVLPASVMRLAYVIKKLKPDNVLLIYRDADGHSTSYEDSKTVYEFVLNKVLPPETSDNMPTLTTM